MVPGLLGVLHGWGFGCVAGGADGEGDVGGASCSVAAGVAAGWAGP